MLKKVLFLMVPLALVATFAMGNDDLLTEVASLKADSISDAQIAIEDPAGTLDVDALANNAGSEKSTDAIEACFRRCGYGGGYGGYGYGYGCYNYCYQPCYNYCYHTYYCYRPVYYSVCYPVYNWCWGCY